MNHFNHFFFELFIIPNITLDCLTYMVNNLTTVRGVFGIHIPCLLWNASDFKHTMDYSDACGGCYHPGSLLSAMAF
jgi:hypothetical protein